ncbi:DUF4166 domain-containing protein [Marilutibacter alkalisoli]|uniref:DUF4166 domain-containing protein n=1 Tax=Marilutibacter alkalisoli TaxID=2591633 RepID=A0A514BU39_9GAMM|nr:DUF4166 domain-containing protein [Lysobacter alkalisoli]QDH70924.1 DUF4166 domain-containing protein [Lysobacter alkalisoli]
MHPTVFQQVLRAPFFNMPESLRALHGIRGRETWAGRATIERGRNPLAWLCAVVTRLPPSMRDAPTRVEFIADEKREIWRRDFNGRKMVSKLYCRDGLLCERLGLVQFRFVLHTWESVVYWNVEKVRLLGLLPLPARLFSGVQCREREHEGRYEFHVEARLPLAGLLIRYEGWLEPA